MSKCSKCGNETLSGDIHWEMGLCNKCYNELYKGHNTHISLDKMWLELTQDFRDENEQLQAKIADLQSQLAEKDKEIEELKMYKKGAYEKYIHKCEYLQGQIKDLYKKQNQKAIEQLEKVKGLIANHTQELWTCENDDIDVVLYEEIDNQIKELKGKVETKLTHQYEDEGE